MQFDKLIDEECEMLQQLKKIFNEMNVCATQTFNVKRFFALAEEYDKTVDKLAKHVDKRTTLRQANLDSMVQSFKHHLDSKSK